MRDIQKGDRVKDTKKTLGFTQGQTLLHFMSLPSLLPSCPPICSLPAPLLIAYTAFLRLPSPLAVVGSVGCVRGPHVPGRDGSGPQAAPSKGNEGG